MMRNRAFVILGLAILFGLVAFPGQAQAATFTVTKTADTNDGTCDADCSLREAIIAANGPVGADIITLPAGIYTLALQGLNEDASATGDLDITDDLTITGDDQTTTIIDGGGLDRVFDIFFGSTVDISDVTIRNGVSSRDGGGINNDGALTLTNINVSGNLANGNGGGISNFINGMLTAKNVTINGNTSEDDGGGISNDGTLNIANIAVSDNTSGRNGGGIFNSPRGTMTLANSVISNNTVIGANGGGISNEGSLAISHTIISGNDSDRSGGGIYAANGLLTVRDSTISDNSADSGGGIFNGALLTLTNSTLRDNSAFDRGGGIVNSGTATITRSTVSNNSAGNGEFGGGGGIFNGINLTITNTTVSSNSAVKVGGGIANNGFLTITNGTISNNSAPIGGGVYQLLVSVDLVNTVIAGNPFGDDCAGIVTSLGHNLDSDNTCSLTATGDIPNVNPLLGPLQNNGGSTETHALLTGSPAIDAGDNNSAPPTDQRGVSRPQGSSSDIGAYEFEPSANLPPVAVDDFYSVNQDSTIDTELDGLPGVLDNDKDPEDDDLIAIPVGTVSHGELALNPSGEFTYTPEPGFSGEASFIYFAFDGLLASNEVTVTITVVPLCTLDIELSYVEGTLTLGFDLGTLEPATWGVWLVAVGQVIPLWSTPIPTVEPSATFDIPIPFPSIGKIGVLTALFTSEGVICSDWDTVDTGVPSSSTPVTEELRELFREVNANQVLSSE